MTKDNLVNLFESIVSVFTTRMDLVLIEVSMIDIIVAFTILHFAILFITRIIDAGEG